MKAQKHAKIACLTRPGADPDMRDLRRIPSTKNGAHSVGCTPPHHINSSMAFWGIWEDENAGHAIFFVIALTPRSCQD